MHAVVVTAGGTREPIDPVRFIGNRSSGKQGYAIADELARARRRGDPGHHGRPAGAAAASRSSAVETAAEMEAAVVGAGPTRPMWS